MSAAEGVEYGLIDRVLEARGGATPL